MKPLIRLIPITIFLFFSGFIKGDKTDDYVSEKLKQYRIPGAAILVIKDGKIIKKNNYGTYSIEFNLPVTDSSIFPLASVTKIFTSTVVMKLVEQGQLSLDQPVTDFMDSLPDSWKQIRIRHLLSHTSGIVNHFQTRKGPCRRMNSPN
jgi:CubicO group peptidase (beta-lactamase class C family)